jgi:hypothetical protein
MRDQKRMQNASPAKKVDAALAVWPPRRLRMADAVQQNMITMTNPMIKRRRRGGESMR